MSLGNLFRVIAVMLAIHAGGCATSPEKRQLSVEEQVRVDSDLGRILARKFESQVKLRSDIEVAVYLRDLATTLASKSASLKDSPIGILVIEDPEGKWRDYSVPGLRVYLSVGGIKSTEFENELAAAIALQLGHVQERHLAERVDRLFPPGSRKDATGKEAGPEGMDSWNPDFFTSNGLFDYSIDERLKAVDVAVEILYQAGFDPRGVVSLWTKHLSNPDRSPYSTKDLTRLLERSHRAIASFSPLRNPVVRSKRYVDIMPRIRRL